MAKDARGHGSNGRGAAPSRANGYEAERAFHNMAAANAPAGSEEQAFHTAMARRYPGETYTGNGSYTTDPDAVPAQAPSARVLGATHGLPMSHGQGGDTRGRFGQIWVSRLGK